MRYVKITRNGIQFYCLIVYWWLLINDLMGQNVSIYLNSLAFFCEWLGGGLAVLVVIVVIAICSLCNMVIIFLSYRASFMLYEL